MNPLDKLGRKLSLTRAEITLVSVLLGFLVLGGILKNFRSMEDADRMVKKTESARFSETEVDSLIGLAALDQKTVKEDVAQEVAAQESGSAAKRTEHRSWEKKVFTGTVSFNKASSQQLQKVPGIGPVMAERLIAFRKAKGGRVDNFQDFLEVKGIGKQKLELLKKQFTLE